MSLNTNGTFIMFSQFAEDITKHMADLGIVQPTSYKAFNINYTGTDDNITTDIAAFESSVSNARKNTDTWTGSSSFKNLFEEPANPVLSGNIELQSSDIIDGIGYTDIYCYITTENANISPVSFNTIIIYYTASGIQDIPLGIYFTGHIEGGKMTNEVTLYKENDEIFGANTTYGLRVCYNFVLNLEGNVNINTINVTPSIIPAQLSKLMTAMAKSIDTMEQVVADNVNNMTIIKNELDMFINERSVNVPYMINGEWYVNGKLADLEKSGRI